MSLKKLPAKPIAQAPVSTPKPPIAEPVKASAPAPTETGDTLASGEVKAAEVKTIDTPVETPAVETPEPAAAPAPTEAPTPAPELEAKPEPKGKKKDITFTERVNELKENGTSREKNIIYVFEMYLENMKPGKPMSDQVAIVEQNRLWQSIKQLFNNQEDFDRGMHLVIGYVRENINGVFHDSYTYRGFDSDQNMIDADNSNTFYRVIHMLKVASGLNSYQQIKKSVDLVRTLEGPVFDDDAKNRVIGFFS